MSHVSNIVHCDGPNCPHAFDIIPLKPRNGALDARCLVCCGHGEWNLEIDLVSFRCKRTVCPRCLGAGWVETGNDPIAYPDIEMTPGGYPRWTVSYVPREDADEIDPTGGNLLAS